MFGLGTLINTGAVVAGGIVGMLLQKGLKENYEKMLMNACGVATIFIGISGTLKGMFTIENGVINTQGSMLLIFSLVLGGLIGEFIKIEEKMDLLGEKLKQLFRATEDNKFVEGFVNTSLIICVGAMAIVGAIQDGLMGDSTMLIAKAVLDFAIVIVLASSYGLGAVCSAIPIFLYQGGITVLAHFAGNVISDVLIGQLSYIGSALIFCVGINIAFGKKFPVGNMLPALLIPVFYQFIH